MFRQAGSLTAINSLPGWSLLFAREPEPEPDLDLDEPLEDSTDETAEMEPDEMEPDGGGKKKLVILVVLAVLIGGGLYLAMDSGMLAGLMGSEPASGPAVPPSTPENITPSPQAAKPPTPPEPANPLASAPAPISPPDSSAPAATRPPVPAPPSPVPPGISTTTGPSSVASAPPQPLATSRPGNATRPDPLFREGQHVIILADPVKPTGGIPLLADVEGTRPGPTVPPDTEVTVLDGELRNNAWFYSVRAPQGATGWVSENRLRGARP